MKKRLTYRATVYAGDENVKAVFIGYCAGGSDDDDGIYKCELENGEIKRFKTLHDNEELK